MPQVSHNGRELVYSDQGSGEPVMFLHGIGSRGEDWKPQTEVLGNAYRVITLDFSGHGGSSAFPELQGIDDLAQEVLVLLNHLKIDQAHIIGLSLGGMVAFSLMALEPKRIRSLTIINSGPGGSGSRWRRWLLVYTRILLLNILGVPRLAEKIALRLFPDDTQEQLAQQFLGSMAQVDLPTYKRILGAIARFDVFQQVADLPIPLLAICGDRDYTPTSEKARYVDRLPRGQLVVIEDSGHATPMDQAEACNNAISNFLAQLELDRGDRNEKKPS